MSKPLVKVTWLDAHGSATTAYAEHEIPHAGILITTYGLLLREDAVGVTIANEFCADGTYRGCTFVPAGMLVGKPEPVIPQRKKKKAPTPPEGKVEAPEHPLQP